MDITRKAAHQVASPQFLETRLIHRQRAPVTHFAQAHHRLIAKPSDEHRLRREKHALEQRAGDDKDDDEDQRAKRVAGQVSTDVGFQPTHGDKGVLLGHDPAPAVADLQIEAPAFVGQGIATLLIQSCRACLQLVDVLSDRVNLMVNPFVHRLPAEYGFDEWVHGRNVGPPKECDQNGAKADEEDRESKLQREPSGLSKWGRHCSSLNTDTGQRNLRQLSAIRQALTAATGTFAQLSFIQLSRYLTSIAKLLRVTDARPDATRRRR